MVIMGVCLLAGLPAGCLRDVTDESGDPDAVEQARIPEFSKEVEAVLWRRIELVEELAAEEVLVDSVRRANRENASKSDEQIQQLDAKWRATETSNDLYQTSEENDCATLLKGFRYAHRGFAEIFTTDAKGLVVAATNRTTDYVQADEPWWRRAFNEGKGESYHGAIEYDQSASSESISLNVPVLDPDTGRAIGVIKAVCDIMEIKREL
jgi:hypothetical protein